MSETKKDIEAATVVVNEREKNDNSSVAKLVCAGVVITLLLLTATLVPTYLYMKTATAMHSRAVSITVEIKLPGHTDSRAVDATLKLPEDATNAQSNWHLMTTSNGSPANEDDRCTHLLHTEGKTYHFKSAACAYPLTDVTDCSVRDATEPMPLPPDITGVEELFARNTTALRVASPATAVQGDADPFGAPAVCAVAYEAARADLLNDVRTVSVLSVADESTRAALISDVQKEDPEGFWFFAFPCNYGPGPPWDAFKQKWIGQSHSENRKRYKTPNGDCKWEWQTRSKMCSGFYGAWYPWSAWSGTYQYSSCTPSSTHANYRYVGANCCSNKQPEVHGSCRWSGTCSFGRLGPYRYATTHTECAHICEAYPECTGFNVGNTGCDVYVTHNPSWAVDFHSGNQGFITPIINPDAFHTADNGWCARNGFKCYAKIA